MKKLIIYSLLSVLLFGSCAITPLRTSSWTPYIGCPEQELRNNWGYGGDSSTYYFDSVTIEKTWYHKNLLFGMVLPGFSSETFDMNILITLEDGIIDSVSYH